MSAGKRAATRRTAPGVAATVVTLLVAGVAVAYWLSGGSGSGTAATGTVVAVTLSPGTPTAQLHPGGHANVQLTLTNPNAADVRVEALALDTGEGTGGFAVDGAHSGCDVTTLGYETQTDGGDGWTVPANDALSVTLPDALSMTSDAADACQGATFTVYLVAS